MDSLSTGNEPRPYRSHKIPACDRCRKGKLRCEANVSNGPCRICRDQGIDCTRSQASKATKGSKRSTPTTNSTGGIAMTSVRSSKRPRISGSNPPISPRPGNNFRPSLEENAPEQSGLQSPDYSQQEKTSTNARSSMIIGPVIAEDVQLLEQYMATQARPRKSNDKRMYDTVSDNPKDPVIYLSVSRQREGLSSRERPGEKQKEILEQILGPNVDEVVNLYGSDKSLSPALICDILASSLVYWRLSPILKQFPVPDQRYCWNLAVESLQGDFLAPGLSTLYTALLDLSGRPVVSITGNTLTSGRTVALAHSLGLNRDPSRWRISDHEKNLRTRLWWGVLIHDRWSSFAHGVPAHIRKNEYDVSLPTLDVLLTERDYINSRIGPAECFILLCALTEVLGDILPLLYDRRCRPVTDVNRLLRRLEIDLDEWEESLPVWAKDQCSTIPQVSGSSSLRLGFLSAKMLLCRVAFHSVTHSSEQCLVEVRAYRQAMLRESAKAITTFLTSLTEQNLNEFWMPYSAYHICSATIILLRCVIDTTDVETAESCKSSLFEVKQWLSWAHTSHHWDLAEICLAQCAEPIDRLNASSHPTATDQVNRGENFSMEGAGEGIGDMGNVPMIADIESLMNGFEYPFVDLWEMFEQEYQQP
ncbi:hypothetical protein EYC80_009449 [Monilinia laxa]|uniref:Zn(2)-C6 fungal-type domain-containing protein n=1 Tax=Monilinia laxa TaxID=61186 RepID=A0A5N6JXU6_MONLA|nr:hypothetical protein EYC80_009449 [Monilinia laxa]